MVDYVVSFCIPTFNREDIIYRVVTQILSSNDPRFQVVVSDNGSKDHTWDKLSAISDPRLKLCENPYAHTPPTLNWLNALEQGDGRWLYLVMGRDLILADHIPRLISYLEMVERKNVAYCYDNDGSSKDRYRKYHYYTNRADALERFIREKHPTGSIFRKDAFMTIPNKVEACQTIDVYPENYFKSKIIEHGWNCVDLPFTVNKKGFWAWGTKIPRSTYDPNPNSIHWFPNRRIKQYIQMVDLVCEHSLTVAEHDRIFITQWKQLMYLVSDDFSEKYANNLQCTHYGLTPRKVTKKEMLQNIFQAFREVSHHYPNMSFHRKRMMLTTMFGKICEILLNPY